MAAKEYVGGSSRTDVPRSSVDPSWLRGPEDLGDAHAARRAIRFRGELNVDAVPRSAAGPIALGNVVTFPAAPVAATEVPGGVASEAPGDRIIQFPQRAAGLVATGPEAASRQTPLAEESPQLLSPANSGLLSEEQNAA